MGIWAVSSLSYCEWCYFCEQSWSLMTQEVCRSTPAECRLWSGMAGSQGAHMHSVGKDSQTQALMAEVLQGSRPSSVGKCHGGGLCGADLGQAAAPVAWVPFPFSLCFPSTHSGRIYLLSAYCLPGSLFRNLIPKGNLQLPESWEYDLRQLVYWELLNYLLYILILILHG